MLSVLLPAAEVFQISLCRDTVFNPSSGNFYAVLSSSCPSPVTFQRLKSFHRSVALFPLSRSAEPPVLGKVAKQPRFTLVSRRKGKTAGSAPGPPLAAPSEQPGRLLRGERRCPEPSCAPRGPERHQPPQPPPFCLPRGYYELPASKAAGPGRARPALPLPGGGEHGPPASPARLEIPALGRAGPRGKHLPRAGFPGREEST